MDNDIFRYDDPAQHDFPGLVDRLYLVFRYFWRVCSV